MKSLKKKVLYSLSILAITNLAHPTIGMCSEQFSQKLDTFKSKSPIAWFNYAKDATIVSDACDAYRNGFKSLAKNSLKAKADYAKIAIKFAQKCKKAKQPAKAIGPLMDFVKSNPSPALYLSIIELFEDYGDLVNAYFLAKESFAKYPYDEKLATITVSLMLRVNPANEVSFAKAILKKHPRNSKIITLLGHYYEQKREWGKAFAIYNKASDIKILKIKKRVMRRGLSIGKLVFFPTHKQIISNNTLFDQKEGENVHITLLSGKSLKQEAEKFVLKTLPNSKNPKAHFVKSRLKNHPDTAFVYGEFSIPKLQDKKITYNVEFSTSALVFTKGNTTIMLSIAQSQMNAHQALEYLSKLMDAFMINHNNKKVSL